MKIKKEEIKKILCIKPRGIGDIVLSTIILENLTNAFPNVKIDYLTEEFAKASVENNPIVNKVITMQKNEFFLRTSFKVRKENYNLILDLWSNPRTAQITYFSGVKYRIGFAYRGRKYAYNILATSERGNVHSAEHNLEILKPLDIPIISKNIHYYISEKDNEFGKDFINSNFDKNKKVIGILPSGGWASKRCDAEKWVEICKKLNEKFNSEFLIIWGPGDEEDSNYIKNNLGEIAKLAPKTDVNKMSGLINNCNLIIANDSGPMHISAALKKPTLGIFGPTDPEKHGPYSSNSDFVIKDDLFCIKCNLLECPYNHECMLQLDSDIILKKVENLLNEKI